MTGHNKRSSLTGKSMENLLHTKKIKKKQKEKMLEILNARQHFQQEKASIFD